MRQYFLVPTNLNLFVIGTLSLTEIAVGLGKLMDGSPDDRLHIVFQAYDLDHNDSLDFNEIVHMISIAILTDINSATLYARAAFDGMKIPINSSFNFIQFREAVATKKLAIGSLWESVSL